MKMIYNGPKFENVKIEPVLYSDYLFEQQIELESKLFQDLRRINNIQPYRIKESSPSELEKIKTFFKTNKDTFFCLVDGNILIASILLIKNYIQCLSVDNYHQKQGIGTELTKYAVNIAIEKNYKFVELEILTGNISAQRLYKNIGFIEV